MTTPIYYLWTGDVMQPLNGYKAACDEAYVVGEAYRLDVYTGRSSESHRHYFACIRTAFANLSESEIGRFPDVEYLRKWALVQAGYCKERAFVTDAPAGIVEAIRFTDQYAVIEVKGNVVMAWVAELQSAQAMGRRRFQESKDAVLRVCAELIGVTTDDLASNAKKAA